MYNERLQKFVSLWALSYEKHSINKDLITGLNPFKILVTYLYEGYSVHVYTLMQNTSVQTNPKLPIKQNTSVQTNPTLPIKQF
jgi:hypothetical protein